MEEKKLIMICLAFLIIIFISCATLVAVQRTNEIEYNMNQSVNNTTLNNTITEDSNNTLNYSESPDTVDTDNDADSGENIATSNKVGSSSDEKIDYIILDKNGKRKYSTSNKKHTRTSSGSYVPDDDSVTITRHDYSDVEMNPVNKRQWEEKMASGKGYAR